MCPLPPSEIDVPFDGARSGTDSCSLLPQPALPQWKHDGPPQPTLLFAHVSPVFQGPTAHVAPPKAVTFHPLTGELPEAATPAFLRPSVMEEALLVPEAELGASWLAREQGEALLLPDKDEEEDIVWNTIGAPE